jgi:predicted flavoprotein YhiN
MITSTGIEGSLVYAASARIRDAIARTGAATVHLDLLPGRSVEQLLGMLARQGESKSVSNQLRSIGIEGVRAGLLRERWSASELQAKVSKDPQSLACDLKAWPLRLTAPRPIAEAISTAGGVRFEALTERAMLNALPGVYCAGEMIDWEAPTGGYLLNACLASGAFAADGVISTFRATEPLSPAVASPA